MHPSLLLLSEGALGGAREVRGAGQAPPRAPGEARAAETSGAQHTQEDFAAIKIQAIQRGKKGRTRAADKRQEMMFRGTAKPRNPCRFDTIEDGRVYHVSYFDIIRQN